MNVTETNDFLWEYKISVELAFQYNFVDFHDTVQAFKGTATIIHLDGQTGLKTTMPLVVGEADIVDDLINPITPAENQIYYFNTERVSNVDNTVFPLRSIEPFLDAEKNSPDESWGNLFPFQIDMKLNGLT